MRIEVYDYIEGTDYLDLESRKVRYIRKDFLKKFLEVKKKKGFEFQHEGALLVGYAENQKIIIYYSIEYVRSKKWD